MKLNLSSASWRMLLFTIMNTEQGIMNNEVLTVYDNTEFLILIKEIIFKQTKSLLTPLTCFLNQTFFCSLLYLQYS